MGDGSRESAGKWGTVSVDAEASTEGGAKDRRKSGDAGFLGTLRTMIFGSRDPESDLNVEMLEELHMITGCEFCKHPVFTILDVFTTLDVMGCHVSCWNAEL